MNEDIKKNQTTKRPAGAGTVWFDEKKQLWHGKAGVETICSKNEEEVRAFVERHKA